MWASSNSRRSTIDRKYIPIPNQHLPCRVLILKDPPEVFCTGGVLTQAIGHPTEYEKNKEHGFFAEHADIRILLNEGNTQSDTWIPTQDIEGLLSELPAKLVLDEKAD